MNDYFDAMDSVSPDLFDRIVAERKVNPYVKLLELGGQFNSLEYQKVFSKEAQKYRNSKKITIAKLSELSADCILKAFKTLYLHKNQDMFSPMDGLLALACDAKERNPFLYYAFSNCGIDAYARHEDVNLESFHKPVQSCVATALGLLAVKEVTNPSSHECAAAREEA